MQEHQKSRRKKAKEEKREGRKLNIIASSDQQALKHDTRRMCDGVSTGSTRYPRGGKASLEVRA